MIAIHTQSDGMSTLRVNDCFHEIISDNAKDEALGIKIQVFIIYSTQSNQDCFQALYKTWQVIHTHTHIIIQ